MSGICPTCQQREMKHGQFECTMCERATQDRITRANERNHSWQDEQIVTMTKREEIATRIMTGLCSNASARIIEHDGNIVLSFGTEPVWKTALTAADAMIALIEESEK